MKKEIKYIISGIITILSLIIVITFTVDMLLGVTYTLNLTKDISNMTETPKLQYFPLYIFMTPTYIPLPYRITLDTLTQIYLVIYIILLSLAITRKNNIYRATKTLQNYENDIMSTISLMSLVLILSIMIEFIQTNAGIPTGNLESSSEYLKFVSALIAPLIEEIGFRLSTIGTVSLGTYLLLKEKKVNLKDILIAIWRPYKLIEDEKIPNKSSIIFYVTIIINGLIFGLAHFISGGGWEIGKISTASLAGIALGYLYVKYGFHSAVLGHSFFNIYLLSLFYISSYSIPLWNFIIDIVDFLILVLGILTFIHYTLKIIDIKRPHSTIT